MTSLDADEVLQRGLSDCESLSLLERLVFLLLEFEVLMDMEGWDDFFTSRWSAYYPELKQGLVLAADEKSVEILDDYETHLKGHGVVLEPSALDKFLCSRENQYFVNCRDWRDDYAKLGSHRWSKVREFLRSHDVSLA
jgi:hypothetical protein